jgi:purine-cytosine permease-like protein
VAAIQAMLPSWMAIPYLLTAFGGLLLSNHLSVYSAGLTMITLGIRVRRVIAVGADVVLTLAGGVYLMLIAKNFYGPFITFISLLAVAITSWVAVFLVDMLTRREYDPAGLMDTTRGGVYWHHGGVAWSAFVSWAAGIVTGLLLTVAQTSETDVWFAGPLSKTWPARNGLGWLVAFVVAAVIYLILQAVTGRGTASRRARVSEAAS